MGPADNSLRRCFVSGIHTGELRFQPAPPYEVTDRDSTEKANRFRIEGHAPGVRSVVPVCAPV